MGAELATVWRIWGGGLSLAMPCGFHSIQQARAHTRTI